MPSALCVPPSRYATGPAAEGIELRVGINTGEALVTLARAPGEGETMAAGDVVNTAARLQSAADPAGSWSASKRPPRPKGDRVRRIRSTIEAKGKAQPVPARWSLEARARPHVESVQGASLSVASGSSSCSPGLSSGPVKSARPSW